MKNTSSRNSSGGFFIDQKTSKAFFKMAYYMHTKKPLSDADFFRDEKGKPHLQNGPKFSISHSDGIWAVTFMGQDQSVLEEDVGMDIEIRNHNKKLTPRFLKKILAPEEKPVAGDYLNNFVIKEAYGKLTGQGLGVGFQKIDANMLIKKYHSLNLSNDKYIWWILQGSNL